MSRPLRRLLVAACACLLLLGACTRNKDEEAANGGGEASPRYGASPTAGGTPTSSPVPLTASQIADKLACTEKTPGQKEAADPVAPADAVDCKVGEVLYKIRTYRSNAEVDEVVKAAGTQSSFRNVGEKWLVAVDNEAGAKYVLQKVGGRIVDLRYTTPGS